ncbi:divisome protein SepX/GlpR [Mycolicibacterium celeriflavum]|uniref:divisome protein SepX/GlpR n=1 Tax=Mycolicibacterium celeriflavum TaxID=1249101 RepID=UPI003CE85E47
MPSIPQSLLWISLVVLWLFVLVPMLISKRDTVRRTSDVALSTRVLNSGRNARLLKRRGPAAGHASDPDWRPSEDNLDEDMESEPVSRAVVRAAAVGVADKAEPDYLDVDVIDEDSGALPVGESDRQEAENEELTLQFDETDEAADEAVAEEQAVEPEPEEDDDEYETVDDSSGLEAPSEADLRMADSLSEARRRRHESKTAAAVSERKYRFRKRMLTALGVLLVASAAAAYTLSPTLWWACGAVGGFTVLYLGYLRRQTRIEERLRRRRAQRIARSRLGVENTDDREFDVVPARLRRPGSVVLEIDDEDPIFEHLDYAPFARHFDLPRAAGQ